MQKLCPLSSTLYSFCFLTTHEFSIHSLHMQSFELNLKATKTKPFFTPRQMLWSYTEIESKLGKSRLSFMKQCDLYLLLLRNSRTVQHALLKYTGSRGEFWEKFTCRINAAEAGKGSKSDVTKGNVSFSWYAWMGGCVVRTSLWAERVEETCEKFPFLFLNRRDCQREKGNETALPKIKGSGDGSWMRTRYEKGMNGTFCKHLLFQVHGNQKEI